MIHKLCLNRHCENFRDMTMMGSDFNVCPDCYMPLYKSTDELERDYANFKGQLVKTKLKK